MSCPCKNTSQVQQLVRPKETQTPKAQTKSKQPSFLDIVKGNGVTPPNGTYKMRVKARVGEQIHKGTGLLTYTTNPDGSIEHYFQTNLDGSNAPFIPPLIGKGFLNLYEYQSHHNSHHTIHSFITNKVNIHDQNLTFHINADPASCCCCETCCYGDIGNACNSCNSCTSRCCRTGSC